MKRMMGWALMALLLAAPAWAQEAKPLMVVRFQNSAVVYENALFNAMNEALKTNPDMRFDVIGFSTRSKESAGGYAEQVANAMVRMGLPAERIRTGAEAASGLSAPEVRIFIQ